MTSKTHEIFNQFDELSGYNLFSSDIPLQEMTQRFGASHCENKFLQHGALMGSKESYLLADQANRHLPELHSFDMRGRRIDFVEFHPAWHQWMSYNRAYGLHASPFVDKHSSRWTDWAAHFYMHAQIEAGSQCPTAMTLACIPLLQREPHLWNTLGEKILSYDYDPRDLPITDKRTISFGMGMTEKQGGSDVRSNETSARPVGLGGRGQEYLLRGHKWFFSAPMCDAHLVVAKTQHDGLACFYVPRWLPDGNKNMVNVQQLKKKVGNKSNSSSEVEFADAWALMIGENGRGIPTMIEMANYTRVTCSIASSGFMRQALTQCVSYTRKRRAFGRLLIDQPLMRGVLADMALETEASLLLSMRLAHAFQSDDASQLPWRRIITPASKFWVCKRAVELTGEAMEVFGGNGYVETGVMARLFKEAPVNSIWEGSGNVMCLDVMRAIEREPELAYSLLDQFALIAHADRVLLAEIDALRSFLKFPVDELEGVLRRFTSRLVVLAQASLLREYAPQWVADAFISTRYDPYWGRIMGGVDMKQMDMHRLLQRALPE